MNAPERDDFVFTYCNTIARCAQGEWKGNGIVLPAGNSYNWNGILANEYFGAYNIKKRNGLS